MFIRVLSAQRLKKIIMLGVMATATVLLLLFPQASSTGVSRGLSMCASLLIPSLFPFLIVSQFLSLSGLCQSIGRRLHRITMLLFGLPGCCAPALLLSFVGGYPTGATAVAALYRQGLIDRAQAGRMLRFCVCAGPAFLISAVGVGMLGSVQYGLLLYVAHLLSALLLGVGERLLFGVLPQNNTEPPPTASLSCGTAAAESIRCAGRSLLVLCSFVVAFCTLLSLLDAVGFPTYLEKLSSPPNIQPLRGWISGLLEVTSGCLEMTSSGSPDPFLLGMILGFGSLSVHCQVSAAIHGVCSLSASFWTARLLHAFGGGFFTLLLIRLFPVPLHVLQASNGSPVRLFTVSAAVSVSLLMMCALFLLGIGKKQQNSCISP